MICENKIFQNIYSNCNTKIVSGLETTIWLFNREDIEYTLGDGTVNKTNEVTTLSMKNGKVGYRAFGLKKNYSAGFERVQSETAADSWTNTLNLVNFQFNADALRNIDEMGNIVAVVERKGVKSTDGTFLVLGLENGMWVNSDSWSSNDNSGARQITLSSLDEAGEAFSAYSLTLSMVPVTPATEPVTYISTYEQIKEYLDSLCAEE